LQDQSKQSWEQAERLVVMEVLLQLNGRPKEVIHRELAGHDHTPAQVDEAISALVDAGVLEAGDGLVWATPPLERLVRLGLVAI
jgi:hypothetical protein